MIAPLDVPPVVVNLLLLAVSVLLLWFVCLYLGRVLDPLRRHKELGAKVAAKVQDNDRITLENRIRRHPDYVGVQDHELPGGGAPMFDHSGRPSVQVGPHPVNPGCPSCASIVEALSA